MGELVRSADRLSRSMLHDVTGDDAPALLRTWGETVQSAGDLWRALPAPEWTASGQRDHTVMTRLDTLAQTMHRSQVRAGWPGEGPLDVRLLHMAETFTRAADLIERYHRPRQSVHALSPEVRADVEATRVRVLHVLNVSAHAIGVAVRRHVDDEWVRNHRSRNERVKRALPRGQEALARLEVFERLTTHAGPRLARASAGEHVDGPPREGRLQEALVRWDIHAHRAAAYSPTPATLAVISTAQVDLANAVGVVVRAGLAAGQLVESDVRRVGASAEATVIAWSGLADRWQALTAPTTRRVDQDFLTAVGELRAAVLEITHDRTTVADPQTIAERVDVRDVAHSLQEGLAAAADLANVVGDAARDPKLLAPARAVLAIHRTLDDGTAGSKRPGSEPLASPVDPRDVQSNRPVALSALVRADLVKAADDTVTAAGTAMSAASVLERSHAGPAAMAASERQAASRRHEQRVVQMVLPLPSAAWAR
ncbi:hypothetical protein [Aquipuribacter hungaricus]|uniref:Uncharacterized protein n=1 Tax=Aquipuribacter hungaricus TaxID=545624 RepID=A0ABV7WJ46_9MICO